MMTPFILQVVLLSCLNDFAYFLNTIYVLRHFYLILCVYMFYLHICMYTLCMASAYGAK